MPWQRRRRGASNSSTLCSTMGRCIVCFSVMGKWIRFPEATFISSVPEATVKENTACTARCLVVLQKKMVLASATRKRIQRPDIVTGFGGSTSPQASSVCLESYNRYFTKFSRCSTQVSLRWMWQLMIKKMGRVWHFLTGLFLFCPVTHLAERFCNALLSNELLNLCDALFFAK